MQKQCPTMHRRDCALLQREVEGTRRLVTSHGFQAVCRRKRAQVKLPNRQIASRPGLASRWAARPPRRAQTKSLRGRQRLFPAAAKVGKIGLLTNSMPLWMRTQSRPLISTSYTARGIAHPFELALVQQCALSEDSLRLCVRRLLDCFAPGS
jgi:hypothetical protein